MKHLVGKLHKTTTVEFMGDEVELRSMSINDVLTLQEDLKDEESVEGLSTISKVIRAGVVGAEEMSDDEIQSFPMMDLLELANTVMENSGLRAEAGND